MRIYLASAYSSHPHGPSAAWSDAIRAALRVHRQFGIPLSDVHGGWQDYPVIWSPVIVGHIKLGKDTSWRDAMRWCHANLRGGKFSHLYVADTPGRAQSKGIAEEVEAAKGLGMQILWEDLSKCP